MSIFTKAIQHKKKEVEPTEIIEPNDMNFKVKPNVENSIEFDYELYKSNWKDLYDNYLDHIIEDIKGGNITKGDQEDQVNHLLKCATMCDTWHHSPKHKLLRAKAMFVSDAAIMLGVSMSRDAKFFDGIRTERVKKHETHKSEPKQGLVPGFNKKEPENQW